MTNAELIQKIRDEIERRKNNAETLRERNICIDILSFIDTLESDRPEPYNPVYDEAYLNEKIKKATESWKGVDVDAMLAECRGYDEEKSEKPMNQDLEKELARFYLKDLCGSEKDEIPEATLHHNFPIMWDDLRDIARHFAQWGADHTPLPEDTVLFNKGVEEGKRLMMEEAEEVKVGMHGEPIEITLDKYVQRAMGIYPGDKVRIIILKED